jgi:hypothetical protein
VNQKYRLRTSNKTSVIPECFNARAHARSTFREELDVLLRKCRESKRIDSRLKIAGMTGTNIVDKKLRRRRVVTLMKPCHEN